MKVLNRDEMLAFEDKACESYHLTRRLLMENAGRSLYDIVKPMTSDDNKVIIVAGRGNNGGDAFVLARQLYNNQIDFELFVVGDIEKIKGEAYLNYDLLKKLKMKVHHINEKYDIKELKSRIHKKDILVDGLLGLGIKGPVRDLEAAVIEAINLANNYVLSIDLPSGVHGDTGIVNNIAVHANKTVAMGLPKIGNILYPGAAHNGQLVIGDIGISKTIAKEISGSHYLITKSWAKDFMPKRIENSHKGTYGKASIIAGSRGMSGAAILTALAALKSGIGGVELYIPESIDLIISTKVAEIITHPLKETQKGMMNIGSIGQIIKGIQKGNVVAIGPGCGNSNEIFELIKQILEQIDLPLIIDADGLNALSKEVEILKKRQSKVILTPHIGEMARLIDRPKEEVIKNQVEVAKEFAKEYDIILVLKSARTIIALPNGDIYINTKGNSGMSTAGTGDILTGIITALVAQGIKAEIAAVLGVFIHGYSGDIMVKETGASGMIAEDIIKGISEVFKALE